MHCHEHLTRRFSYVHRRPACPVTGQPEGPTERCDDGLLVAHGPCLAVSAFGGEDYFSLTSCGMQSGRATCVLVRSLVDGPVESRTESGDGDSWPDFFASFLALMPPGLAAAVREVYSSLRDDLDP